MKIIAIEGLDKSGKFSLVQFLKTKLALQGVRVVSSEFHRYDTPTGELIAKWLRKEWDVDQKTIELVMAADKQAQQEWFKQLEADGVEILLLDRYTLSQYVYATNNGIDEEWATELQRYMRQPDYEIILDIPAEVSMARKGKHNNGENDRYESDRTLLSIVRYDYARYARHRTDVYIVDATQSIETVQQEAWNYVQAVILKQ